MHKRDTLISPTWEDRQFFPDSKTVPRYVRALHAFISSSNHIHSIKAACRPVCLFLLPSPVRDRFFPRHVSPKTGGHGRLASLDGLRGLACLFVLNEHLTYNIAREFLFPYGFDNKYYLIQLPIIRLMWSGFSMVSIFFVISGYVLSYKPIAQIQARDMAGFNKSITSAVIRRGIRLYMPTTVAIMMTAVLAWVGVFAPGQKIWDTMPNMYLHEIPPPRATSLSVQLWDAWLHAWPMFREVWHWGDSQAAGRYDMHLWTIPVEFRSSMVLFLVLVGVARLRRNARIFVEVSTCLFAILSGRRDVWMFVGGMLLADTDLLRLRSNTPTKEEVDLITGFSTRNSTSDSWRRLRREAMWIAVFLSGLFLLSVATVAPERQTGFQFLLWLASFQSGLATPEVLKVTGAICTVMATANSRWVSSLFTNSFCQYLGKISYALYIVHNDVLCMLEYVLLPRLWLLFGITDANNAVHGQAVMVWAMTVVVVLPVTLWVADVFWRAVDTPSVRFARYVESKITWD